ncbi:hypothetical protein HNY73_019446 [Argiope bruennichi]|uniref:Uncharacterized protein n=1 Tax=Argiope bruennichi TaxID=94029 RepID=A0A8T0E4X7_ARGBR|nr:hypothetical protein HNY73_019446 [Argiope bruennichi]
MQTRVFPTKTQYLIQAVEEGSKAERLVQSFPATASNYPKAIQQLQERFGRDDLLVQIYVRDLLSMSMEERYNWTDEDKFAYSI